MTPLSVDELAARARTGDRRAAARLRARVTPEARGLAVSLTGSRRRARAVVRTALAEAMGDTERPYASAVVVAVSRHAQADSPQEAGPEERLKQAVGVLCDVQGRTHDDAGALLGLPVERVVALHDQAREDLGLAPSSTCHGWHLVSRLEELTAPEQAAGRRHLDACRRCTDALQARAAARVRLKAALPVGGTAVGALALAGISAIASSGTGATVAAVGIVGTVTAGVVSVPVVVQERPDRPAIVQQAAPRPLAAEAEHPAGRRFRPAATAAPSPTDLPASTRGASSALVLERPRASAASARPSASPAPSPSPDRSSPPPASPAPRPSASPVRPSSSPLPPDLLGIPLPELPGTLLPLPAATPTPTTAPSPSPAAGHGGDRPRSPEKYRPGRSGASARDDARGDGRTSDDD